MARNGVLDEKSIVQTLDGLLTSLNQIRPPNKRDDIIALLTDLLEGRDILDQDSRFKAVLICGQLLSDVHSLVESEWSRKQRKQWRIVLKSALQLLVELHSDEKRFLCHLIVASYLFRASSDSRDSDMRRQIVAMFQSLKIKPDRYSKINMLSRVADKIQASLAPSHTGVAFRFLFLVAMGAWCLYVQREGQPEFIAITGILFAVYMVVTCMAGCMQRRRITNVAMSELLIPSVHITEPFLRELIGAPAHKIASPSKPLSPAKSKLASPQKSSLPEHTIAARKRSPSREDVVSGVSYAQRTSPLGSPLRASAASASSVSELDLSQPPAATVTPAAEAAAKKKKAKKKSKKSNADAAPVPVPTLAPVDPTVAVEQPVVRAVADSVSAEDASAFAAQVADEGFTTVAVKKREKKEKVQPEKKEEKKEDEKAEKQHKGKREKGSPRKKNQRTPVTRQPVAISAVPLTLSGVVLPPAMQQKLDMPDLPSTSRWASGAAAVSAPAPVDEPEANPEFPPLK